MKHTEMMREICRRTNNTYSFDDVRTILMAYIDIICDELADQGIVDVRGIGKLYTRIVDAGIHPHYTTGEWCRVFQRRLFLKPSTRLKNALGLRWVSDVKCPKMVESQV